MTFDSPALLLALLLVPLVVAAYVGAQRRRTRHPVVFPNLGVLAEAAKGGPRWRRHVPAGLMLLALCVVLIGAARPHARVQVPRSDATVVLVLDVSGSMRARDVEPTRLAAAQAAARTFVEVVPEAFQIGLVSFSDVPEVLAQPTTDRPLIDRALDTLQADGGTAIGDALTAALELDPRREGSQPDRSERPLAAIVLLSDGYQTAGQVQPLDAARNAATRGLPVYTVALGTPEGIVEVPGPNGFPQLQRVPPDPETLGAIAELTEGEFFEAPTESDLRSIYESLGRRIGFVTERREVTAAFAGAGFALAAAALGLAAAWGRRFP